MAQPGPELTPYHLEHPACLQWLPHCSLIVYPACSGCMYVFSVTGDSRSWSLGSGDFKEIVSQTGLLPLVDEFILYSGSECVWSLFPCVVDHCRVQLGSKPRMRQILQVEIFASALWDMEVHFVYFV